jgi:5-(carboxyamino)imidazole ribonucleotide synthase
VTAILPGSTIGILGGGQLGRMTAMAARSLGYRVQVMDPSPSCPARFVVDACFEGSWDDAHAAKNLARGSDVVTLEIEQVTLVCLETAAKYAPVRPGASLLRIVQDRILQKNWLRKHNYPVGEFYAAETASELLDAVRKLGGCCFIKSARGGYDGRGQAKVNCGNFASSLEDASANAWSAVGKTSCIVEKAVDLEREISVMVARSPSGEIKSFPSAWNYHENQILAWSVIPSAIPKELEIKAQKIAVGLATHLQLEGLLAVELFVTKSGDLLVNEMAPRPHNSYHASEQACVTSQFEQAVRAVCDLPLGDVSLLKPAAIANLLGDLWLNKSSESGGPRFDRALRVPGVSLYLYEKHTPRPGRKMGHLSAIGNTPEEAVNRVLEAQQLL